MKNLTVTIIVIIGVLISNLIYAQNDINPQFEDFDSTVISKVPNYNDIYEIILDEVLEPDEMTYKNNIIMFMIDDEPYMYSFDLAIKLSNAGVEQKITLYVREGLLTRITQSKETVIKIGGNKDIIIKPDFKEKLREMLFNMS